MLEIEVGSNLQYDDHEIPSPATSLPAPSRDAFIHLVFPVTRATKQWHVAAINVNSSAKEYEPNA